MVLHCSHSMVRNIIVQKKSKILPTIIHLLQVIPVLENRKLLPTIFNLLQVIHVSVKGLCQNITYNYKSTTNYSCAGEQKIITYNFNLLQVIHVSVKSLCLSLSNIDSQTQHSQHQQNPVRSQRSHHH